MWIVLAGVDCIGAQRIGETGKGRRGRNWRETESNGMDRRETEGPDQLKEVKK
jgi:hypothetical protein